MGSERSNTDPRNPTGSKSGVKPDDNSSVAARALQVSDPRDPRGVGVLSGRTVGRYQLILPIGAGGMAQVWAAKPKTGGLARTVAMKLVLPEFGDDPEYGKMFVDEAMVASAVRHPNVCEIHELGRDGDLLFMVLEWIAGDSLTGLLTRGSEFRPLPDEIAARIASEACAGLHSAHEAIGPDGQPLGIVHRDVSPPNILVSMQGHVKVSDFGIAKARYQLHSKTRTGEIKGKFAYIPPEQILGRGVDRRADIYAMGCVLVRGDARPSSFRRRRRSSRKDRTGSVPQAERSQAAFSEGSRSHHREGVDGRSRPALPDGRGNATRARNMARRVGPHRRGQRRGAHRARAAERRSAGR